jgi:GPH family glycoside/pentoside/hexuronide:cation symporter
MASGLETTASNGAEERLPLTDILTYSIPAFATSMILVSVAIYLPNFYTDELGVTAGMLSWVFLAGRVWDAVTDPVMGHISDRTQTRWGRRRPYFLISAVPICFVFYVIWTPDRTLSPNGMFMHLLLAYLALYTFWTVFSIPYISLGMELTPAYHERTRLFGTRQAFFVAGTTTGMLAPALFASAAGDKLTGYAWMAAVFGVLALVLILIAFARLREKTDSLKRSEIPFFEGLRITFRNRGFVVLLFVYLAALVGGSFIAPLTLYMAKYVIKAEWVVKYVMLAYMAGSLFSIPLWLRLSRRVGKNKAWTVALIIATIGYGLSYTYHEGTWIRWIVLAVVVGAGAGCSMTLGPAISADVIDSDELETGKRREGAFMGVWSFVDKAAIGLAVFVGLQGLDYIGYVPNVDQTPTVIEGMKFLYCVLPTVCHIVAIIIFQWFPITPEVHAEIRAKLDARAASEG